MFNGAYPIKTNIAADYITLEAGRQWGEGGDLVPTRKGTSNQR